MGYTLSQLRINKEKNPTSDHTTRVNITPTRRVTTKLAETDHNSCLTNQNSQAQLGDSPHASNYRHPMQAMRYSDGYQATKQPKTPLVVVGSTKQASPRLKDNRHGANRYVH